MTEINETRLQLLLQQEQQRIVDSNNDDIELPVVQARGLCWLVRLAEAHDDQANDAERRGDTEQAMGWFADAQRLRDVINLVTKIDIPYVEEDNSLSDNPNEVKPTASLSDFNSEFTINHSDNFLETSIRQNLNDNKDEKLKEDKIYKKFEEILKLLENHCENISRLINMNDAKLLEKEKIEAKIFQKIKDFESLNKNNDFKNLNFNNISYHSAPVLNCHEKGKAKQNRDWIRIKDRVLYGIKS